MSAIRYYETGCDTARWSDHPECVSPVVRSLCIALNDRLPSDAERERVIGPHLFTPLGTLGDLALEQRRAFRCADMAVRVWAPRELRARGFDGHARTLESLRPIVDVRTTQVGRAAAAAAAAYSASAAAAEAAFAASNAAHAADAAFERSVFPAADAAYAASNAAHAADAAFERSVFAAADAYSELLALILELCSWSDRPELDPQLTRRVLREACKHESHD